MLIEKRFQEILEIVNRNRSVTVQELMKLLGTSESTIRRDLNALDAEGKLIKVHGGAVAVEGLFAGIDAEVHVRQELNAEAKEIVAEYAASLISNDDFVYIDAGTTTEKMIEHISVSNAVFVTNAWGHAKKLSMRGYKTYILGGEIKPSTEAVVGNEALGSLMKYNFTKGFFGTNGIGRKEGFSTPDIKEASIKNLAMKKCRECYILADKSKFSKISPVSFAEFTDASIITTGKIDKAFVECANVVVV